MDVPAAVSNTRARAGRPTGEAGRRTSLQGKVRRLARVGLAFQLVLVVLVLATSVLVAEDGLQAAKIRETEDTAANLLSSMADQQTGLLTYLKPAQPDSLLLYFAGKVHAESALADLRADTRGTSDAALVVKVEAALRKWQSWAETLHAQQQPITDPIVTADGSHLFALFVAVQHQLVTSLDAPARAAGDRTVLSTEA